jgi:hypothetical protein
VLRHLENEHGIYIDSLEYRYDDIKDLIPNRDEDFDSSHRGKDYSRQDEPFNPPFSRRTHPASAPSAGHPSSANRDPRGQGHGHRLTVSLGNRVTSPKGHSKIKTMSESLQKSPKRQSDIGSSSNDFGMNERPSNSRSGEAPENDSRSQESTGLPTPTNTIHSTDSQ